MFAGSGKWPEGRWRGNAVASLDLLHIRKGMNMSNDQSYMDGQKRDVRVVKVDAAGNTSSKGHVIGQAATYAEALDLARSAGYAVVPEGIGHDVGSIAGSDGPDAYGIPVYA